MTLSPEASKWLSDHAISQQVMEDSGVWSIKTRTDTPKDWSYLGERTVGGLVFPWNDGESEELQLGILPQNRWVDEVGEEFRYRFATGAKLLLNKVRDNPYGPILLVEGTKQHLSVASHTDLSVYGFSGAYNWGQADLSFTSDRDVVVIFDGDVKSNRDVWDAASLLMENCHIEGARSVKIASVPVTKKDGIDDLLGRTKLENRESKLRRILQGASDKMPRRPAKKTAVRPDGAHEEPILRARDLYDDMMADGGMSLAKDDSVAVYSDGIWSTAKNALISRLVQYRGNAYRSSDMATMQQFVVGRLHSDNSRLPEFTERRLIGVSNGILDIETLELVPEDPDHGLSYRVPVAWSPKAKAPFFEDWVSSILYEGQVGQLYQLAGQCFDSSMHPEHAGLFHGGSNSGKSTLLGVIQNLVGAELSVAESLKELSEGQFSMARLYGKILVYAGELSADHLSDTSRFKALTGRDTLPANKKYGGQFDFTNRATPIFSCNEIPTVSESSTAYVNRIKYFYFPNEYVGSQADLSIPKRLRSEREGIFRLFIEGHRRRVLNGGLFDPTPDGVQNFFERASSRVAAFVHDHCDVHPVDSGTAADEHVTGVRDLHQAFIRVQEDQAQKPMGAGKFGNHLNSAKGVSEVRARTSRARGFNVTLKRAVSRANRAMTGQSEIGHLPAPKHHLTSTYAEDRAKRAIILDKKSIQKDETILINTIGNSSEPKKLPAIARPTEKPNVSRAIQTPPIASSTNQTSEEYETTDLVNSVLPDLPKGGTVYFDLETHSAAELWSYGPGFVRVATLAVDDGPVVATTDIEGLVQLLHSADRAVGHNILGFDLLALARYHQLDIMSLDDCGAIYDTMTMANLVDPPPARQNAGQFMKSLSLDTLGQSLLGRGKSSDLKKLAKKFGGFGHIPLDHKEFIEYAITDVEVDRDLARHLGEPDEYAREELHKQALLAQITLKGFMVDSELLSERKQQQLDISESRKTALVEKYGIPTENDKGELYKKPSATLAGKTAIVKAFEEAGVEIPLTAKGNPAFDKETLTALSEDDSLSNEARELAQTVKELNGARTVYQTLEDHVVTDFDGHKRVHPLISTRQASGRMSTTSPGLTVLGKRGGKWHERDVLVPEPGHLIQCYDMAQVDCRSVAAHSQDLEYLALFEEGVDSHTEVAKMVWNDPSRRTEAKMIAHAWNYGSGPKNISAKGGVPLETCYQFDREMKRQFPQLEAWKNEVRAQAESGELIDNGFGRKMRVEPDRAWTQAPALVGQGGARDLFLTGLRALPKDVAAMVVALVHDEIVLSVPEGLGDYVDKEVLEAFSFRWAPPGKNHLVRVVADKSEHRGLSWGDVYGAEG